MMLCVMFGLVCTIPYRVGKGRHCLGLDVGLLVGFLDVGFHVGHFQGDVGFMDVGFFVDVGLDVGFFVGLDVGLEVGLEVGLVGLLVVGFDVGLFGLDVGFFDVGLDVGFFTTLTMRDRGQCPSGTGRNEPLLFTFSSEI